MRKSLQATEMKNKNKFQNMISRDFLFLFRLKAQSMIKILINLWFFLSEWNYKKREKEKFKSN